MADDRTHHRTGDRADDRADGGTDDRADDEWLADTRASYDTVAVSYAELLRDALAGAPLQRGALALFADLVRAAGGGPVADIGCGTGRLTGYLARLGLDIFGVDLSPGMIEMARRDHPELRFAVGTMTDLELDDGSVAGVLAWWSLIHVPDHEVPAAFAEFARVLRPGGPLLVGFFMGDEATLKTDGYGGHPMKVYVYRRPPERVAAWLAEAGFRVDAELRLYPEDAGPGAVLYARRSP